MLSWVLNQPAVASVGGSDAFGRATSAMKQKQVEIEFAALNGCTFTIEMIITSLDESIADVEIAPTHSKWN
jgi:hypothetical protein